MSYYNQQRLDRTRDFNNFIDKLNRENAAIDYVIEYFRSNYGKTPNYEEIKREKKRLSKHLFKSKTLYKNLKTATSVLSYVGIQNYLGVTK